MCKKLRKLLVKNYSYIGWTQFTHTYNICFTETLRLEFKSNRCLGYFVFYEGYIFLSYTSKTENLMVIK